MARQPTATDTPKIFTRDGYHRAEDQYLTPSGLKSLDVHGRDDTKIGAIRDLMVGPDAAITDAVVDIGGFLGIGMHSIRVPFADLTVLRKSIGTDIHVCMDATEDQIKAMPHFDD